MHSGATHPVTINLAVVLSQVPLSGSATDIVLSFPSYLSIPSGNFVATVTATVGLSAVPGTYILTNTVSASGRQDRELIGASPGAGLRVGLLAFLGTRVRPWIAIVIHGRPGTF